MIEEIKLSLVLIGLWAAMKPGMVLHPLTMIFDACLWLVGPKFFLVMRKPLYYCSMCMVSFWGVPITMLTGKFEPTFNYLFFMLSVAAINYIIELLIVAIDGYVCLTAIKKNDVELRNRERQAE